MVSFSERGSVMWSDFMPGTALGERALIDPVNRTALDSRDNHFGNQAEICDFQTVKFDAVINVSSCKDVIVWYRGVRFQA
jgi:hypothetical protein